MTRSQARRSWRSPVWGLRAQLLFPAVVLLVLTMMLIALANLQTTQRELLRQAEERAMSHAAVLSELAPRQPETGAEREAMLSRYAESAGLDLAAWHTHDSVLYASHGGELRNAAVMYVASHDPRRLEPQVIRVADSTFLFVGLRAPQGVALVALDLASVQRSLKTARQSAMLFITLNATLLLILGYALFTFAVVRPIRALAVATERASQGDLASPLMLSPRNELGQLARRFNVMLERLAQQRAQLTEQVEELARANAELQQAQDSLIRSEKLASVGQLAAGVAHEVGNPLAAVYGYSELLAGGELDGEETREIGGRIRRQVERMRATIRELLDFSREHDERPAAPIDVLTSIEEALSLVSAARAMRGVTISRAFGEPLPRVQGHDSQLVQVLVNLLLNAADALDGESQPAIMLSAQVHEDQLVVGVEDNGHGLPAELSARVFDPFFTTKAPGKGTGLGLAVALKIMRRMGGELAVVARSPDERGARFELTLPLAKVARSDA